MGGRPPVVGLLAGVAAVLLASLLAASPAYAQMRIPLFGDAKPKVVKKRPFRPTLPYRNPLRVTAGVTAAADPPAKAENSEVAAAVGTSSTASVSVALAAPQPGVPDVPTPAATGSESSGDSSNSADMETSQSDDVATPSSDADTDVATAAEDKAAAKASDESAGDTTNGAASDNDAAPKADTADAPPADATPAPEAKEAAEPPAGAEETTDSSADEPAAAPDEVKQTQTTDADAEEPSTPSETAESPSKDDAPESTAATDASDAAAPPAPSTTAAGDKTPPPAETGQAAASADAAPTAETAKPAAAPSYDASVVLEVSPPPDAAKVASAAPATDQTPPAETKETQTASLTPPDAPMPDTVSPADDEQPAAAEAEPDSNAADSEEATKTPGEEADQPATAQEARPSDETAEPASTEPAEAEPAAIEPPPAHPVVAAIRAKLDDPGFQKSVSESEHKALEAFYGTREGPPLWITDDGFTDKAKALIAEIDKADDWGLEASDFDVPRADAHPSTEEEQAAAELKLDIAALKYARYAEGGRRRPSSYSPLFDQHPKIRSSKAVLTELAAASAPDAYLTSLQPQHEQFKRLRQALLKARAKAKANGMKPENDRDVQLIVMNMERWRWLPRHLGTLYVWDNVPEFNTRVIKNGKTIYVEETIVGQLKYATPLFSAPMRNIVFHPNWTVPPTIVNEDLAPALQGDGGFFGGANTAILRNHGLKVSLRGKPVDPDTVDWKNVNIRAYTFTQDPGPDNVLGQLKFNFPNRHAIYMHDTVQPELFDQTMRALSHGCIRVHAPDRFAGALLGQDKGWSMAQVRNLLAKSDSTVVPLNRRIPVHITYFTAVVDQSGNVNKLDDIYGIDNRMAAKMFANPARFPIPATPPDLEANNRPRPGSVGLDSIISGLFGN